MYKTMKRTTVAVDEEVKAELVRIAARLQEATGRRADLNDAIRYLISLYKRRERRPELFALFCKPVPGLGFEEAYEELVRERRADLERLERKYQTGP